MHRLLIILLLALGSICIEAPQAWADSSDSRRYSQVANYIRRAESQITYARNHRSRAESCQRDAERYLRQAEDFNRRGNFDRVRDCQRRAERASEQARGYIRQAERAEAEAAGYLRRAAIAAETR